MVDGATHLSEGYLDVRITFGLRGITHNFHFLAIPTGDRAHTGETYATLVLGALRAVAGEQVLLKLIGIATDGAATMLGCNRGFVTRIKAACIALGGGTGIVANWCGSHQLNLVVNTMLGVFDEFVDFRSTLGYEIAFTHTHETVKKKVGSCPTYATTRWESIHDACVFLAIHYTDLLTLQLEKQRSQSCPQWWLCLFLLADMTRAIKLCFAKLQYKNVTIAEQYQALHGLARTMQNRFEDTINGTPQLSEVKIEGEICHSAPFARKLYLELRVNEQQQLVLMIGDAVQQLIDGAMGITLAVDEQGSACDLSTPKALVDASDNEFAASLDLHVQRLSYQYGSAIVSKIWSQRRMLKEEYNTSRSLKNKVDRVSTLHVNEAWSDNDFTRRFADLKTFAIGLASVPPGTHTVESDFSILRRVRNKQRTRLTNFSMEGEMHATQFFDLVLLAESSLSSASGEC